MNIAEIKLSKQNEQDRMNELMSEIDNLSSSPTSISHEFIYWLWEVSQLSEKYYIQFDHKRLVNKLLSLGFKDNIYLDLPKESYDDISIHGNYVVGQVIDNLNDMKRVHPAVTSFFKRMRPL